MSRSTMRARSGRRSRSSRSSSSDGAAAAASRSATHDVELLAEIERAAAAAGFGRDAYEIQMLYGIRVADQRRLAQEGFRVRVLISYGTHWYPWFMRRVAEHPGTQHLARDPQPARAPVSTARLLDWRHDLGGCTERSRRRSRRSRTEVARSTPTPSPRWSSSSLTGGVDGVLACGTTGEGVLLTVDERRHVAEASSPSGPRGSRSPSTPERRPLATPWRSPRTRSRSAPTPSP